MNEIQLEASRREPGRSTARALRRSGYVPGVYYFHGTESIPVSAHVLALRPLIYTSEQHLVNLVIEGEGTKLCVLKDMDFDPITDRPIHFDLLGVAAGERIRVEIPVALTGRAIGQMDGGQVETQRHTIEIECLPGDLPEHIEIDITNLRIGDSIHVSDLSVPNATFVTAPDATIVSVTPPRVGGDTPATDAHEPQVIEKGKASE